MKRKTKRTQKPWHVEHKTNILIVVLVIVVFILNGARQLIFNDNVLLYANSAFHILFTGQMLFGLQLFIMGGLIVTFGAPIAKIAIKHIWVPIVKLRQEAQLREIKGTLYYTNLSKGVVIKADDLLSLEAHRHEQLQLQALETCVKNGSSRIGANTRRLLNDPYKQSVVVSKQPALIDKKEEVMAVDMISYKDALKSKKDAFEFVLGQVQSTGKLLNINLKKSPHLACIGGTGTGKSSQIYNVIVQAIEADCHIALFNGGCNYEFDAFNGKVEYHNLPYDRIEWFVDSIETIFLERKKLVDKERKSSNFDLPVPYQPIVVIVDEFGKVFEQLKMNDAKLHKHLALKLTNMMRDLRKSGIHVFIFDQNPSELPQGLLSNMSTIIGYKSNGYSSSAVKLYDLEKLPPQGVFKCDDVIVNAWDFKKEITPFISKLPTCDAFYFDESASTFTKGGGVLGGADKSASTVLNGATPIHQHSSSTFDGDKGADGADDFLIGEPKTKKEKRFVYEIFKASKNKTEAMTKIWGGKNGQRSKWLNTIIDEFES